MTAECEMPCPGLSELKDFQKRTIAELAAGDYLLKAVWEDCVNSYVMENRWDSARLKRVMKGRIEQIVTELVNCEDILPGVNIREEK